MARACQVREEVWLHLALQLRPLEIADLLGLLTLRREQPLRPPTVCVVLRLSGSSWNLMGIGI